MGQLREDVVRHIFEHLLEKESPLADEELLSRFCLRQDEAAFALLMKRYGPMVRRICRGVVRDEHIAEDVFQATFLVLAQKAGSLRRHDAVGPFLHGTVCRIAMRMIRSEQRRRDHERKAADQAKTQTGEQQNGESELSMREARLLVDAELTRLPDKYRIPLILCCLEGKSHEQAAAQLGMPRQTLSWRVERGRELLRRRLARRGVELTAVLFPALLAGIGDAAAPTALIVDTARLAALFVKGSQQPASGVATLVQNATAGWRGKGWAVACSLFLLIGGIGIGLMFFHPPRPEPVPTVEERESPIASKAMPLPGARDNASRAVSPKQVEVPGRVLDPEGRPVANADVTALAHRPFIPGEHSLRDDILAQGRTDIDGFFRLTVRADFPTWYPERRISLLVHAPGQPLHASQVPLPAAASRLAPFIDGAAEPLAALRGSGPAVEVRLPKADVVRGRLLDPAGRPAQGVTLRLIRLGDAACEPIAGEASIDPPGWPKPIVSDVEGRFELAGVGRTDRVWLQVEDDRFAPLSLRITPGASNMRAQLERSCWLEGRTIAADTGRPIADVRVSILAGNQQGMAVHTVADDQVAHNRSTNNIDTRTDPSGRFRVRFFPNVPCELEFHPPAGSSYLAIRKRLPSAGYAKDFSLPRGVVLRGRLVDEATGKPVGNGKVSWDAPAGASNPHCDNAVIQDAYSISDVGPDGEFSLTVPSGPVRVQAFGPTQDYVARPSSVWARSTSRDRPGWSLTSTSPDEPAHYCHAETALDLAAEATAGDITLTLRKGEAIEGEVCAASGEPVSHGVLLCSGRVSPLRSGMGQPLFVKDGRFVLPGCEAGRLYTVLVLDPKRREGAVAKLTCPGDPARRPRIRLEHCGEAHVRYQPVNGASAENFPPDLYLRLPKSYPIAEPPGGPAPADLVEDFGIDPIFATDRSTGGADGVLTLPRLIPGAEYLLTWQLRADRIGHLHSRLFSVRPAEIRKLSDIAAGFRAEPASK